MSVGRFPRAAKAALLALIVVGLLSVVALGARGGHPGAHGRASQRVIPARLGDDVRTTVLVLYAVGVIALVVLFMSMKRKWAPVKSHWLRDFALTMALMSVLAVIGFRLFHSSALRHAAQQQAAKQAAQGKRTGKASTKTVKAPVGLNRSAHLDWQLALALVGLIVFAGGYYWILVRRRLPPNAYLAEPIEEALGAAVSDAIDDLRSETDPRRAVIAAYARMEGVLARHGHPRLAAEAPFEYLARVLLGLRVRAVAVHDLTELFERAKFSTHPIDVQMKERAISALVSVRDDLQTKEAAA